MKILNLAFNITIIIFFILVMNGFWEQVINGNNIGYIDKSNFNFLDRASYYWDKVSIFLILLISIKILLRSSKLNQTYRLTSNNTRILVALINYLDLGEIKSRDVDYFLENGVKKTLIEGLKRKINSYKGEDNLIEDELTAYFSKNYGGKECFEKDLESLKDWMKDNIK